MKAGQQVTPTLRLTRLLGKGGMGSVWLADHITLGAQVAIKFMAIANLEDQTLLHRFRTEAKAAAQIKHPHVAQVFDHGVTEDGIPYIVMEFLEGEDLKHAIRKAGPLPLLDVARIITQAAKALGRAHTLGIVHRDIKPANLLLDVQGLQIRAFLRQIGVNDGAQAGGQRVLHAAVELDLRVDAAGIRTERVQHVTGSLFRRLESGGQQVLRRRRAKGRHRLTVEMNNHVKKINWNS